MFTRTNYTLFQQPQIGRRIFIQYIHYSW